MTTANLGTYAAAVPPVHFEIVHEFDIPLDAVELAVLSPNLIDQLAPRLSNMEQVEQTSHAMNNGTFERVWSYHANVRIPAFAKSHLTREMLGWDEHSVYDLKKHSAKWTIVPTPDSALSIANNLQKVSCTSATNCTAVGLTGFVIHFNGTSWSLLPPPPSGALDAVTCASGTDCTAVGTVSVGSTPSPTLIAHWDGASWTVVGSPSPLASSTKRQRGRTRQPAGWR